MENEVKVDLVTNFEKFRFSRTFKKNFKRSRVVQIFLCPLSVGFQVKLYFISYAMSTPTHSRADCRPFEKCSRKPNS